MREPYDLGGLFGVPEFRKLPFQGGPVFLVLASGKSVFGGGAGAWGVDCDSLHAKRKYRCPALQDFARRVRTLIEVLPPQSS